MATHVAYQDKNSSCGSCEPCESSTYSKTFFSKGNLPMDPSMARIMSGRWDDLTDENQQEVKWSMEEGENPVEEEQSFVDKSLELLDREIRKIRGKDRVAYDLAERQNKHFVENRDFRLKFLRGDGFVAAKAARRMMNHFQLKLEIFGEQKLVKDITYDDLDADDKVCVNAGSHQFLGATDLKGRSLVFLFPNVIKATSVECLMRAQYYQYMLALEDEETQKNGLAIVLFGYHQLHTVGMGMKAQTKLVPAVPVRPVALHVCYLNQQLPIHARALVARLGRRFKMRFRFHLEETAISLLYSLQAFGINPANVPLEYDGQPQTKLYLEIIEKRKAYERQTEEEKKKEKEIYVTTTTSMMEDVATTSATPTPTPTPRQEQPSIAINDVGITPTSKDVLLGRGLKHPGNTALDKLIDMELASHKKAPTQFHKTCIVLATVRRVEASGGRFLKRDSKTKEWVVVGDTAARDTVSTRFKKRARKINPTQLDTKVTLNTVTAKKKMIDGGGTPPMEPNISSSTIAPPQPTRYLEEQQMRLHLHRQMQLRMNLLRHSQSQFVQTQF